MKRTGSKTKNIKNALRSLVHWTFRITPLRTFSTDEEGESPQYLSYMKFPYMYLSIGWVIIVSFFTVYPAAFWFMVAVLFDTGATAVVSQIIVFFFFVSVYMSTRSLFAIREEYIALDDVVRTIESERFNTRMFQRYFERHSSFDDHAKESFIENKIRMIVSSKQNNPDIVADLQITRIHTKHAIVAFIANMMPLLGLTGTLLGLSIAISGMQGVVSTLGNISGLATNLDIALAGMGGAFFTTLFGITAMLILRYFNLVVDNAQTVLMTVVSEAYYFRIFPLLKEKGVITHEINQ